jgi:hypothetical protein
VDFIELKDLEELEEMEDMIELELMIGQFEK